MLESRQMGCPYCAQQMRPVKVACGRCGIALEGSFRLPRIAMLAPDQAAFLAEYALAGFSLKALEERVGMSYPAVRARLDRIIASMKAISGDSSTRADERRAILDRLEQGQIKADDAIRMIERLSTKGSSDVAGT